MSDLKKPAKIKTDDPQNEEATNLTDNADAKDANKVVEQANPEEVPPLPDDDKEFDREPEKRLV